MTRRELLRLAGIGAPLLAAGAALPKLTIKRVRYYASPFPRPSFNQSTNIVTIETDAGITGVGEGGTKEMIEQLGALLIDKDASHTEQLWQTMYRGRFYPPGREKLHALGALDMALWDIKGKALGMPVYRLLGGPTREKVEAYATGYPDKGGLEKTARACIEEGFRAYRFSIAAPEGRSFNSREVVVRTHEQCQQIRSGVGRYGDWAIDFHTKLDTPDAVDLCTMIQDLRPLFVEDLVRSENPKVYRTLRQQVKVPIAVGEQFGDRWDINELIEDHLINYSRITLPNAGGITEFMKIAAIAETHYVGLIPHFTGPISEAALVHCLNAFSGPAFMERQITQPKNESYVPQSADFRSGSFWPNDRPGLGVEFTPKAAKMVAEVTEYAGPLRLLKRPDGSYTNW